MAGQAGRLTFGLGALIALSAAAPAGPVTALAGRYSHAFANALVSGERYRSEDIVEIVPVDARHAYVRLELQFYNGHQCSLTGVARAQGETLVYQAPAVPGETTCRLAVRRAGAKLTWDDGEGSCKSLCGARGSFGDGDLPWVSRRPIRYLPRLKTSREYRSALAEWRTGRPAQP